MSDTPAKIEKSDAEWRAQLTPEQYHITRQKGTEAPFTGKLTYNHDTGMYRCVACGADLFASDTKFDSGSVGPASTSPSILPPFRPTRTPPTACCGLKSPAHAAARISATSSPTAPNPPVSATASTPPL